VRDLLHQWPSYLAYLVSFATLEASVRRSRTFESSFCF
jgi:hypothetical protein